MGSDFAMQESSYRNRPNYAEWDGDELVVFKDSWYDGFKEFWRGPVTESNKSLILTLVSNIPEKPEQFHTVTIKFSDAEYNSLSTSAAWEYHGDVNGYIKALALGWHKKGC